jgi:hypothetical protein
VEAVSAASKQSEEAAGSSKAALDEIRSLSKQVAALKISAPAESHNETAAGADYSEEFSAIKEQIRQLTAKLEKQEPKAPKVLVDELRALSATVQSQESTMRRAVADEVRSAVTVLQNGEPRDPKALLDEIRNISASVKAQESRPQPSSVDQFKVLSAQIQALADRPMGRGSSDGEQCRPDAGLSNAVAQLRQLLNAASEQFGKCQAQLASLSATNLKQPANLAPNAVALSANARPEPSAVVFYDNVMLRKNQEKQYAEIGVNLSLQTESPREIRLAVNRQGFGLAFGERKVFRSQDVECELALMETDLNGSQARVSISCKR